MGEAEKALKMFMDATSPESQWGTWWRMDDPDLYTEIEQARAAAVKALGGQSSSEAGATGSEAEIERLLRAIRLSVEDIENGNSESAYMTLSRFCESDTQPDEFTGAAI